MNEQLRKFQLAQVDILDEIVSVCKKYGIRYSLYAGTLLGAVRHKGFIPWDDDLDICMSRAEYDRFIRVWSSESHQYALVNKENTPSFSQSFTKIQKPYTFILNQNGKPRECPAVVFVDIFPLDRFPKGRLRQYLFYWNVMLYQLLTREFVPPKSGKVVQFVSRVLLMFYSKGRRPQKRTQLLNKITKYHADTSLEVVSINTVESLKYRLAPDILDHDTELFFERRGYTCFADWDNYLCKLYGDYMRLPPENERVWKHNMELFVAAEQTTHSQEK